MTQDRSDPVSVHGRRFGPPGGSDPSVLPSWWRRGVAERVAFSTSCNRCRACLYLLNLYGRDEVPGVLDRLGWNLGPHAERMWTPTCPRCAPSEYGGYSWDGSNALGGMLGRVDGFPFPRIVFVRLHNELEPLARAADKLATVAYQVQHGALGLAPDQVRETARWAKALLRGDFEVLA